MVRPLLVKKTTRLNYSKGFGMFSLFCALELVHFPLNLRNTETIKILMCENEQMRSHVHEKSSGAGSVSLLRRLRSPEIIHTLAGHVDNPV